VAMFGFGLLEVIISIFGTKYFSNEQDKNEENKLNKVNSKLFMTAIIGILCLLTMWPGIFILNWTKVEIFEFPTSKADKLSIVLPAIMDTLYATAFIVGISLTNPVFMAVAQLLVVPITFFYDVMFNGLTITFMAMSGTVCIFIGFLLMELPITKYIESYKKKKRRISYQDLDDSFVVMANSPNMS